MATVCSELHSNFRLRVGTVALRLLVKFTPNQAIFRTRRFSFLCWLGVHVPGVNLYYFMRKKITILNLLSGLICILQLVYLLAVIKKAFFWDSCSHHKLQAITSSLVLECSFLLTLSSHCSFQHWLLNSAAWFTPWLHCRYFSNKWREKQCTFKLVAFLILRFSVSAGLCEYKVEKMFESL